MARNFVLGAVLATATLSFTGCQNIPDPDWGPVELPDDPDGNQRWGWGATWQFETPGQHSEAAGNVGRSIDDPALIIVLKTIPDSSPPPNNRSYWIKVEATTGTMTNATRTFTTLQGAISAANEIFDDAGFTSTGDEQKRDDLQDWLETEWITAVAYHDLFGV